MPDENSDRQPRSQNEETLLDEQGFARLLLDQLPGVFYVFRADGALARWNKNLERVTGYSPDGLARMRGRDFVREEAWPLLREKLRETLEEGEAAVETELVAKDGTSQPYYFASRRVEFGGEFYVAGTGINISRRRRTEQDLRRSRQRYEDLINTIDGIVFEADARTLRFTFASHKAERLLGYPVSRWTDEPDFWSAHLHPEDRERAVTSCLATTTGGYDHEAEYRMIAADGRAVWLRDLTHVLVENGMAVSLRGVIVDITEQKRAEEALRRNEQLFRRLIENAQEVITVFDADGTIRYGSPAVQIMLGYRPSEMVGQNMMEFVHPDEMETVSRML
ncbi:MAG: PAS domain S-box protein, partial [Pyrinomonadaceae bacterium]